MSTGTNAGATDSGYENKRVGTSIEEYRAKQRGRHAERTPGVDFMDVDDDGTPVEVKSTEVRVAVKWDENRSPRRGRYQLKEDNHRNLVDHGGEYDFALRDDDGLVAERTMTADEVDDLLDANDRTWPENSKLKLSWADIHDPADVPGES